MSIAKAVLNGNWRQRENEHCLFLNNGQTWGKTFFFCGSRPEKVYSVQFLLPVEHKWPQRYGTSPLRIHSINAKKMYELYS